jgi:hypothetical protein
VIAVRLDLDTKGLEYRKWGATQRAKQGDWLVVNEGDVYTVDARTFARTYKRLEPGRYVKKTPIWAEQANEAGSVKTKEGRSNYKRGDYIVSNTKSGADAYCIREAKFREMYELVG